MADIVEPLVEPPPELRFRRRIHPIQSLTEIWRARELIRSVAERDLRARYKQAFLGVSWAILAPLATMLVLTLFVKRVLKVDTGGVPYPLFVYLGIVPWGFFSSSLSGGGTSLLSNKALLNRIHCPREVFPIASVGVSFIDMMMSLLALSLIFPITGFAPKATSFIALFLLPIQVAFALGAALLVSGIVIYLRDLTHAMSLIISLGFFATPIAYGIEAIPQRFHLIYAALNPMAAVIDGYRRTVLFGKAPQWDLVFVAAVSACVVLAVGYVAFKKLEAGVADVA
jgi:ABC-type polysaccharide/polyol phosphate export permease